MSTVSQPSIRERKVLRVAARLILWALLPLTLLAMGVWDITHRVSWLGFGPDTMRGSFRGEGLDYTLEGMPAVVNGISFVLTALALHTGLWVHLRRGRWGWIKGLRVALWIAAVLLFLTVHWILHPLSQR